jgi:hypothetical protein
MKKGAVLLILGSLLFGFQIQVVNGIYKDVNLSMLKKFSKTVITKSAFDEERHKYTFVFLDKIRNIYCPFSKKITVCAYDDYKVTFTLNELKKKNIIFAFMEDGKPIPIEDKGPAKIIYTRNKNPVKEIFLINKIICD